MTVLDKHTGKTEVLLSKTSNSCLVTQTKLKKGGVSCNQWFIFKDYQKRFKETV